MTVYQPSLQELAELHPDVVIIGAGINGVGLARELALRGVSVAVFDQSDIGSGTSSVSSKLVHGGLRYLEKRQFRLVRESCRERSRLLYNAPHLVWKCPFLFPIYTSSKYPLWMIRIGLKLYDLLAGIKEWPEHFFLGESETTLLEPHLKSDQLLGSAIYQDAQMDDARVCLEVGLHARFLGAKIYTYTPVVELVQENQRVTGVVVICPTTQKKVTVPARVVVSCTGPWTDECLKKIDSTSRKPLLKQSQGIHLVTKRLMQSDHALLLTAISDGRVFFVLPWGNYSIVGTTETPFKQKMHKQSVRAVDRKYLLREMQEYFPDLKLSVDDIVYEFSGVRPLLNQSDESIGNVSREHKLVVHYSNFFTVVGGKYTTFRSVCESVSRRVLRVLGRFRFEKNLSADLPLYGGRILDVERFVDEHYVADTEIVDLNRMQYARLVKRYGIGYRDLLVILSENMSYSELIDGTNFLKAEVVYAIRVEMARTMEDFLVRRTQLGWTDSLSETALWDILGLFRQELRWSEEQTLEELAKFHNRPI